MGMVAGWGPVLHDKGSGRRQRVEMDFNWTQLIAGGVVLILLLRRFASSKSKKAEPGPEKEKPVPPGARRGRLQDWFQTGGNQPPAGEPMPGAPFPAPPPPEPEPQWETRFDQGGPHLAPPYEEGSGRGAWLLWVAPILILLSLTYYFYQPEVDSLISELLHSGD